MLRLFLTALILVFPVPSVKMRHRFILADSTKCVGCLSCELACAASYMGIAFEEAYSIKAPLISRNRVVKVETKTSPLQCMHCEDASCAAICPHGVIERMDGFIKLHEEACVGCGCCSLVCPYGAIRMVQKEDRRVAVKCNLCFSHPEGPSCVRVCTTDAIHLVDYDAFETLMATKG